MKIYNDLTFNIKKSQLLAILIDIFEFFVIFNNKNIIDLL